jgi:hypothetical protein
MSRVFDADLLSEPADYRERFTGTGRVKRAYGGGWSFQVSSVNGAVHVWTIGPLGWWHDFHRVEPGTSFDDALRSTGLPFHFGWVA